MKKRLISLLLVSLLIINQLQAITVYTIGDSTMADRASGSVEQGWGSHLQQFFLSDAVKVSNHGRSGRSTKSFINQGYWTTVKNALQPGDYVFIQFGHNDQKSDDAALYADSKASYNVSGSYRYYLKMFIDETKAKGATPVLMTSVVRRIFDTNGVLTNSLGDYPDAVRELAAELGVTLIDMEQKSRKLVEGLGPEASKKLYMISTGKDDNTHFVTAGATAMAEFAADGICETRIPLIKYVKRTAVEYVSGKSLSSREYFDFTSHINNPDFIENSISGWTGLEVANNEKVEFSNKTFDVYQTISGLPAGKYSVKVQGFERPKVNDAGIAFKTLTEKIGTKLYANGIEIPFNSLYETTCSEEGNKSGYADNIDHVGILFGKGYYEIELTNVSVGKDGKLTVGVKNESAVADSWIVFDNFQLYYYVNASNLTNALESTLFEANKLYDNAEKGNDLFQYPEDAFTALATAISTAQDLISNITSETQDNEIATTEAMLREAIAAFKTKQVLAFSNPSSTAFYCIYSYGTSNAVTTDATTSMPKKFMYTHTDNALRYESGTTDAAETSYSDPIRGKKEVQWQISVSDNNPALVIIKNRMTGKYLSIAGISDTPVELYLPYKKTDNGKYAYAILESESSQTCLQVAENNMINSIAFVDWVRMRWVVEEALSSSLLLKNSLNEAQDLLDNAVVGTDSEQYTQSAYDALSAALETAKQFSAGINDATDDEIDTADTILRQAINDFKASQIVGYEATIGRDWTGANPTILAASGISMPNALNKYPITVDSSDMAGDEVTFNLVGVDGITVSANPDNDRKDLYLMTTDVACPHAQLRTGTDVIGGYFEGKVEDVATSITKIKFNGTSNNLDNNVAPTILFSDEMIFNENKVTGYSKFTLPKVRVGSGSGCTGAIVETVPAGTKSFRVYFQTALANNGDGTYMISATATDVVIAPSNTAVNPRIAYVKVSLSNPNFGKSSAVPTIQENKTAVSNEYFDLLGRKVSKETKGILIEIIKYQDGTAESKKTIIQ